LHGKDTSISDRLYSQTSVFHIKIVILHYLILRQITVVLKPKQRSFQTAASGSCPRDNIRRQKKTRMLITTNAGDVSRL
jgi:hypothetical protein